MTGYHAAVRYRVDASRAEKVRVLYEGFETIAVRLLEDYGQPLANVLRGLDRASRAAAAHDRERRGT